MSKGSNRRNGTGYAEGYDRIFGKKDAPKITDQEGRPMTYWGGLSSKPDAREHVRDVSKQIMEECMSNNKPETYNFAFSYWSKSYGWTLLIKSIQLLITGECRISVNMSKPRDVQMMKAAQAAAEDWAVENKEAMP